MEFVTNKCAWKAGRISWHRVTRWLENEKGGGEQIQVLRSVGGFLYHNEGVREPGEEEVSEACKAGGSQYYISLI